MDSEKLARLAKAWQEKYGHASCQLNFNQSRLFFYHPLAMAETRSSSKSVRRMISATFRFFARIVFETGEVTIELQLGTEKLASYELSDARGLIDSETIYSYLLFERPTLKDQPGIKQKFVEVCKVFLELFRAA